MARIEIYKCGRYVVLTRRFNFFLCGYLQEKVYIDKRATIQELKNERRRIFGVSDRDVSPKLRLPLG